MRPIGRVSINAPTSRTPAAMPSPFARRLTAMVLLL
jgi:hypothetical protein